MPDPFEDLIPAARAFLTDLSQNNSRDWFLANKPRYEQGLKRPALALLDTVSADWGREIGQPLAPKLFRPQRDVRFSRDKTPYHTHLHLLWAEPGGLGWFLGIAPGYVTAGAGVMGFDKGMLDVWRPAVDGPAGAVLAELIATSGARLDPPELKRVPAPFDKAHPRGDLLRRKSLTLWLDIEREAAQTGLRPALSAGFFTLRPALDQLRGMI